MNVWTDLPLMIRVTVRREREEGRQGPCKWATFELDPVRGNFGVHSSEGSAFHRFPPAGLDLLYVLCSKEDARGYLLRKLFGSPDGGYSAWQEDIAALFAEHVVPALERYRKDKPEIEKTLCISTCHVSEKTAQMLEKDALEDIVMFPKGEYGWTIHTGLSAFEDNDRLGAVPHDLLACMKYARKMGCEWLCLDRDAGEVLSLPVYDW